MLSAQFRTKAADDVGQAVGYYLVEGEAAGATRFVDAFPYLVFYLIRGDHLDVLRVLPNAGTSVLESS